MVLPFIFMSCSNDIAEQLNKEAQSMKAQCPMEQGNGVIMTDVNFYKSEKVLEYVCSIDGVESLDAATVETMKKAMVESLSTGSEVTAFEKFSVNTIIKTYDYRFRYLFTDTDGNKLCTIDITKYDL